MTCKICGNVEKNKLYMVKERQINRGDVFQYLYCSQCGTLQLYDEVKNIGLYYENDYYSFKLKKSKKRYLPAIIKKCCVHFISNCSFWLPAILEDLLRDKAGSLMLLYGTRIKINSAILDVGGGNGRWLDALSWWGFNNLTCIDLFCPESPFRAINFIKCDIGKLDDTIQYDLITFNHSFEHMREPEKVLGKVKRLLSPNGTCLIRVPVCECEAWEKYRENWFQIDAPRHYFLFTERALDKLCAKFNLEISKVIYDSGLNQFVISEYYKNTDLRLKDISEKLKTKKSNFRKKRRQLNKTGKGDQAAFYIKHKF